MSTRKSITDGNPALAFISSADEEETQQMDSYANKGKKSPVKANKEHKQKEVKEIKNFRINLALTSSVGEELKQRAWEQHKSVNSFVEEIIKEYLNR